MSSTNLLTQYRYMSNLADACADAAQALEQAADGIDEVLDPSVAGLVPETWESDTARVRSLELGELQSQTIAVAASIALFVAALRTKAELARDAGDRLWGQYLDAVALEMTPAPTSTPTQIGSPTASAPPRTALGSVGPR